MGNDDPGSAKLPPLLLLHPDDNIVVARRDIAAGERGELDGEAFLMKKGDFSRIPRNALHWAWNRSDQSCTLVEVHAPACDPLVRANAVGLFREGETPDLSTAVETFRGGESPDELEARAAHYNAQMEVYARASTRLWGQAVQSCHLVFLTPRRIVSRAFAGPMQETRAAPPDQQVFPWMSR